MAGTLFGLGLSQQIDANGRPMAGCLLYVYEANTTTPATTYQDFGLTAGLELSFPIAADANGRLPQFWLSDGSYRARLTDSSGVVQFDLPEVLALGASSGAGAGGGVDANAIYQTGDVKPRYATGTHSGWVRMNGRTIGSATSGAAERANADCQALFEHLWTVDSNLTVSSGRGGSAAADWAANKTIALPDFRGRVIAGLDDMGNSAAGRLTSTYFGGGGGANGTTLGSAGGNESHQLTSAQLAAHTHTGSGTTASNGAHTHTYTGSPGTTVLNSGGGFPEPNGTGTTSSNGAHTHTFSFTSDSTGSDGSHNNVQPTKLMTFYIKL